MKGLRYLRFQDINNDQCFIIIRVYRRKLFKLFLKRFLVDDAAPFARKFVLRFATLKKLRRGLRALQLFEHYSRLKFKTKKRQISTIKLPGLFYSDLQEERSILKDETAPPAKKRGRRYRFVNYNFNTSVYRMGVSRPLSRKRSKMFSIVAGALPGGNIVTPKFLYYFGFTHDKSSLHLSRLVFAGLFYNFYHFLIVLNSINLML
jgi:hypothetical protein